MLKHSRATGLCAVLCLLIFTSTAHAQLNITSAPLPTGSGARALGMGAVLLFDFIAERHGEHFVGDRIRGFWALFGLAGCVGMTKFMKGIGKAFLMQPGDFYTKHENGEEN